MARLIFKHLNSLSELRRHATAWDDLWQRSEIVLPTARARLIALWCECFAARQTFSATVVEHDGQLVAALPLVNRRVLGFKVAALPGNEWSSAGDLLLDPQADCDAVCEALLRGLLQKSHRRLWFDAVPIEAKRWQALLQSLDQEQMAHVERRRFLVNRIQIGSDWPEYFASRSSNHRRQVRRATTRAERQGPLELTCHECVTPERVGELLQTCFEIEASGWKGRGATAVLNSPAALHFYLQQARQLAAWGQLRVTLLRHQDRPIAFEYGWEAKGTYCSAKVGYDERCAELSPGQLLRALLIEQFYAESSVSCFDFFGPTSTATAKWATDQYAVDRVVVSLRGALGRALIGAYRHGWPLVRSVRAATSRLVGRPKTDDSDQPAAPVDAELESSTPAATNQA